VTCRPAAATTTRVDVAIAAKAFSINDWSN
jgi:hypothetical protein